MYLDPSLFPRKSGAHSGSPKLVIYNDTLNFNRSNCDHYVNVATPLQTSNGMFTLCNLHCPSIHLKSFYLLLQFRVNEPCARQLESNDNFPDALAQFYENTLARAHRGLIIIIILYMTLIKVGVNYLRMSLFSIYILTIIAGT